MLLLGRHWLIQISQQLLFGDTPRLRRIRLLFFLFGIDKQDERTKTLVNRTANRGALGPGGTTADVFVLDAWVSGGD